jgi:hypothetical protein
LGKSWTIVSVVPCLSSLSSLAPPPKWAFV